MKNIFIGDVVKFESEDILYYVLLVNDDETCVIVRKSGKHKTFSEYESDERTSNWDRKRTRHNISITDLKLVYRG